MNQTNQKNTPLVSVGIPTYNRPEGLKRTLECITGQTYKNLEIIVSDNCSTNPEVEKVIRDFQKRDNRIRYFKQDENKGGNFNFRFVFEKATGKYFMWAADDDEWGNFYIAAIINNFLSSGDTFVAINFEAQYFCNDFEKFEYFPEGSAFYSFTSDSKKSRLKHLLKYNYGNLVYSMYRIDILRKTEHMIFVENEIPFMLQVIQYGNWKVLSEIGFYKKTTKDIYTYVRWENFGGRLPEKSNSFKGTLKLIAIKNLEYLRYHLRAFHNTVKAIKSLDCSVFLKTDLISLSAYLFSIHFCLLLIRYKTLKLK